MKVLVTGGAGYIGSHTVSALKDRGYTPIVLDNFAQGHHWAIPQTELIAGSVGNRELLDEVLPTVDGVIHFAAHLSVGESVVDPQKYYQNNLGETLGLLSAMNDEAYRRGSPVPLVFSSTAAVYGSVDSDSPIVEGRPAAPINAYGFGKLAVERILSDFHHAYGTPSISFRYFNASGADPSGTNGEAHDPETHLIPLVLRAIKDKGKIKIFGNDYPTPDGTCIRDYIHVVDLAKAHVLGLEHLIKNQGCYQFNLGTGQGYSVREVIDTALRVTGGEIEIEESSRREGDPPFLVADPTKAMEFLSWSPERSDLEVIIKDAWQWHSQEE